MSDIWHATPIRTLYVPDDGQGFVTVAQDPQNTNYISYLYISWKDTHL
jgi:hypothetical protein